MTHCFIALSLLLTTPIAPADTNGGSAGAQTVQPRVVARTTQRLGHWPKELIWQSSPLVAPTAATAPTISLFDHPTFTDLVLSPALSVPIESPAPPVALPEPTIPLSLRERALNRLSELGATPWQIRVFDCIGYAESGWQSKRSDKINSNGTWDHGPLQVNDIHWPKLNALGLNPYVPEDAAEYGWRLSTQGSNFLPWSVHAKCGV